MFLTVLELLNFQSSINEAKVDCLQQVKGAKRAKDKVGSRSGEWFRYREGTDGCLGLVTCLGSV